MRYRACRPGEQETDLAPHGGRCRRPWPAVLVLALAALARESAAGDCFGPLEANGKWACTAELSSGTTVDYCLNVTGSAGSGPTRSFDMVTTGPYPRTCSCGAKGKGAGARFGQDASYLCFDALTDTAESGKISKKKITGQTYNVSENLRGKFTCKVDPACLVPLP